MLGWWRRQREEDARAAAADPGARERTPALPGTVRHALGLTPGEQVLAHAVDESTGHWLVLTTYRIATIAGSDPARVVDARPWHEIDEGAWNGEARSLSATWVGGGRGSQWRLPLLGHRVPEVFHERVGASVVLVREVLVADARRVRVVMRKDLRTREVFEQLVPGRRVSLDDAGVLAELEEPRREMRAQVGLPPL